VVVDYISKWFELNKIKDKLSEGIIRQLISIFLIHGAPDEIISDNNPFNSNKCKNVCREWGIILITTSSCYPKSNGQVERI